MFEAIYLTIWLACGGVGAYIGWYRRRTIGAVTVGLLVGMALGIPVVVVAQFSLVGVIVATLFLVLWMTLFGLVHRHNAGHSAE